MGDLAGLTVTLNPDVPFQFDAPLSPHHKLIGRWVAARETTPKRLTRPDARREIERRFDAEVRAILGPITYAHLRVVALIGEPPLPPALALICDTIGQVDLGWIETGNVLANSLRGRVPPLPWRAAAYRDLIATLPRVLPVFGYEEFIYEFSGWYWDGATDDDEARRIMVEFHGYDPDELTLPSDIDARRPDFMLEGKAGPLKDMPPALAARLRRLRAAGKAVAALPIEANPWRLAALMEVDAYLGDEYADRSTLAPLTLVPVDQFIEQIDEIGRHGMEYGFADLVGLAALYDDDALDRWFAALRCGAELLLAAQDLVAIDPAAEEARP